MFVSSYNTYLNAINTTHTTKKVSQEKKDSFAFLEIEKGDAKKSFELFTNHQHVDYIASTNTFQTKLLIQQQEEKLKDPPSQDRLATLENITKRFHKEISLKSVSSKYLENTQRFSYMKKPLNTLNYLKSFQGEENQILKKAKEKVLYQEMLSAYKANDNYFSLSTITK